MGTTRKQKRLVLDQPKINAAKRSLGVDLERKASEKAFLLIVAEQRLSKALGPLKGTLSGDKRPWPYR